MTRQHLFCLGIAVGNFRDKYPVSPNGYVTTCYRSKIAICSSRTLVNSIRKSSNAVVFKWVILNRIQLSSDSS